MSRCEQSGCDFVRWDRLPLAEQHTPFALMDLRREPVTRKRIGIAQIDQRRAFQLKLNKQRGMLHKALIVFSPCRRDFPRRIDRWLTDDVPSSAEARGACAG